MSFGLKNTEAGIKLNGVQVNNLRFPDDIGLFTRSRPELLDIMPEFDETSRKLDRMIDAEMRNGDQK